MSWEIFVDEYPNCCGIDVLTGFPVDGPILEEYYDQELKIFREREVDQIQIQKDINTQVRKIIKRTKRRGILQVVLNEFQNPIYGKMLKNHGFRALKKFFNPNTSNTCFLYQLIINQPNKTKVKVQKRF